MHGAGSVRNGVYCRWLCVVVDAAGVRPGGYRSRGSGGGTVGGGGGCGWGAG